MNNFYSAGIDVSKDKSTVCITDQSGEIVLGPKDYRHTKTDMDSLLRGIRDLGSDDMKVVMEATGIYHLPIYRYLRKENLFVSVINPLVMKNYARSCNFRLVKTDKIDSVMISTYGSEKWYRLKETDLLQDERLKLQKLSRAHLAYQKPLVILKQNLDLELDKSMPGIKVILKGDKLYDFVEEFRHFDNITSMNEKRFIGRFEKWAKKKNHRFQSMTPRRIYTIAKDGIPSALNDDINDLTVKIAIETVRTMEQKLDTILAHAREIAMTFPEYDLVREMNGIGDRLAPMVIAEIGDIRRIHSKEAMVSMAGIDVPPYESGQLISKKRKITKKGNAALRRHLYLVMDCIMRNKPEKDNAVYQFMIKKRDEHKHPKQVRVAGMRKFLHIYYARVKQLYKAMGIWDQTELQSV